MSNSKTPIYDSLSGMILPDPKVRNAPASYRMVFMQAIKQKILAFCLLLNMAAHAQKVFNIADYGAKGDGIASNTKAIQNAVNACAKSGGGTVLIPQGSFVTGSVQLFSDINVCLSAGQSCWA